MKQYPKYRSFPQLRIEGVPFTTCCTPSTVVGVATPKNSKKPGIDQAVINDRPQSAGGNGTGHNDYNQRDDHNHGLHEIRDAFRQKPPMIV